MIEWRRSGRVADLGEVVVVLNLLRVRPEGGRERYEEFCQHSAGVSGPSVWRSFTPATEGALSWPVQATSAPVPQPTVPLGRVVKPAATNAGGKRQEQVGAR